MERKTGGTVAERYGSANEHAAGMDQLLGQIRGKTPEEVLAGMSQASLSRCVLAAGIACVVMLAVLTVGPMLLFPPTAQKGAVQASAAPAKPQADAKPAADATPPGEKKADKGDAKPSAEAIKKLGVDETKTSDPKKNPLDNVDDLLKDLK